MNFQTRKRKFQAVFDEIDNHYSKKWRSVNDKYYKDILNILLLVIAASGIVIDVKERKSLGPNRFRESEWLKNGYQNWGDEEFKNHLRLNRQIFELALSVVTPFVVKQPTNMKPTPTPPEPLLALMLYRLAYGCSFPTVGSLFGVSEFLASITFNKAVRIPIVTMYDDYVKLPSSSDE